jgi:hypothetical protein
MDDRNDLGSVGFIERYQGDDLVYVDLIPGEKS